MSPVIFFFITASPGKTLEQFLLGKDYVVIVYLKEFTYLSLWVR